MKEHPLVENMPTLQHALQVERWEPIPGTDFDAAALRAFAPVVFRDLS